VSRDLTTTRAQVFGDVEPGTACRICGRDVTDNRSKTCSVYCDRLQTAVMGLLNWSTVRRRIIDRDDETCQHCGWDRRRESLARDHIRDRIDERLGPSPTDVSVLELGRGEADDIAWDRRMERSQARREYREALKRRYGDPYEQARTLEVDHIRPVADGGHPFDPANLQTLCSKCHETKTARENSERSQTPSRRDLNESLFEYVADGGDGHGDHTQQEADR
jgi:5-methylcytosine-specific restriction endonuclease McrA